MKWHVEELEKKVSWQVSGSESIEMVWTREHV